MKKALKIYLYAWAGLIAVFALFVLFPHHNYLASKPDNIERIVKLDLPDIAEATTTDNLDRGASHWNSYEHSIQFEEEISEECIREMESRCQKDSAHWSKNEAEGYYVYHDEDKDELYGVGCRIYKERACISYFVDEDEGFVADLLLVVYLHIVLIWGFVLIVIAIDRKRRGYFIFAVLVAIVALPYSPMLFELATAQSQPIKEIVKEGDVIFQTTQSRQSPLIQIATRSKISHCGIVVMKNGKPYVLETLNTLKLTPLDKFVARSKGGRYWLKRSDKENIKIRYEHYLGKSYDVAFRLDNDIYYCSELVYDIYKKQLGIELCKPKRIDDYLILYTDKLPKIKSEMRRRGINEKRYVIAPVDVFRSDKLKTVK